ncbi:rhomboid family intramembrane serine protease [Chloroflexales bacterium ZM16-3]|nr:rhomboid family intramembrane serine protease [Chloroflexales bacterium ZM16-3]
MEREFGPRRPREGEADEPDSIPPAEPRFQRPMGPPVARGTPPQRQARPRTPAAMALLWAIVIIYVLSSAISASLFEPSLDTLVLLGAKVNSLIHQGQYWRLLTATFLHANLIHIFFNGYALYLLGPETERIYGTRRFLALYFLAGLGGSLASYLISPAISVGASGAIFGLIGGLGIFYYLNREALGDFGKAQVQNMVTIAMINLFIGFANQGVIDNWGHLGGLAGGALAGMALAPRLRVDTNLYPPVLRREYPELSWAGATALLLVIAAMALLLQPAS